MLKTWDLVTLYCDIKIQSAPCNIVETTSVASSGPKRTATIDNKTAIDKDTHLHLVFGGKTFLITEAWGNTARISWEKDDSDESGVDCPDESTGK